MNYQPNQNYYEYHDKFMETDYGRHLSQQTRFGRFQPDWMENAQWEQLLGADVNNAEHMPHTLRLTKWFVETNEHRGKIFGCLDKDLLYTTAIVHDWAEAIDGDVPDPEKKHDSNEYAQEYRSFLTVAREVVDEPMELAQKVIPVIQGKNPQVARDFRTVEILGYTLTGLRAARCLRQLYDWQARFNLDSDQTTDLGGSLEWLAHEVMSKNLKQDLRGRVGEYPALHTLFNRVIVLEYLNQEEAA